VTIEATDGGSSGLILLVDEVSLGTPVTGTYALHLPAVRR
jgi:hypothetical protein